MPGQAVEQGTEDPMDRWLGVSSGASRSGSPLAQCAEAVPRASFSSATGAPLRLLLGAHYLHWHGRCASRQVMPPTCRRVRPSSASCFDSRGCGAIEVSWSRLEGRSTCVYGSQFQGSHSNADSRHHNTTSNSAIPWPDSRLNQGSTMRLSIPPAVVFDKPRYPFIEDLKHRGLHVGSARAPFLPRRH